MPGLLINPVIYSSTFINKTWLDKVGLPVPNTTDEFKEMDPNGDGTADKIPLPL